MGGGDVRDLHLLDVYRHTETELKIGGHGDSYGGFFHVPSPIDGQTLRVMASSGLGWDHVSVSRSSRCPNWPEMERIHGLFFKPDETAMQLHVPASDHVNYHPYCLHMWRPLNAEIPRPPSIMVGPDSAKGKS